MISAIFGETVTRRILGTALALLIVGVAWVAIDFATRSPGYEVTVKLGQAGSGLGTGSDVKMRGIKIGSVTDLQIEDTDAVARIEIEEGQPVPADVTPVVTAKTLLGEKQVELRFDGPLDRPYLEAGATLQSPIEPTEFGAVLASLSNVLDDIDGERLGTLIDAFGRFDQSDAQVVRRNIELGQELSDFAARTADAQIDRIGDFATVLESFADRAEDITRINAAIPEAAGFLPDNQAAIRRANDALSSFSTGFAEFLEVEAPTINQLFDVSDVIGTAIDPRMREIGNFVYGLYRYSLVFGQHGGSLSDGSEHAWFKAFLGDEGEFGRLCDSLPPELEQGAPGCVVDDDQQEGGGDPGTEDNKDDFQYPPPEAQDDGTSGPADQPEGGGS